MMRKVLGSTFVALLCMATPKTLAAHHSLGAEFDFEKRVEFTGVLTRLAMVNPHVRWYFDVKKPDGSTTQWEITAGSPSTLRAAGMLRIFAVGTTLKVKCMPARDGSNTGRVVDFIFPDGRTVTLFYQDPNNPNDR